MRKNRGWSLRQNKPGPWTKASFQGLAFLAKTSAKFLRNFSRIRRKKRRKNGEKFFTAKCVVFRRKNFGKFVSPPLAWSGLGAENFLEKHFSRAVWGLGSVCRAASLLRENGRDSERTCRVRSLSTPLVHDRVLTNKAWPELCALLLLSIMIVQ